jgi:hypothetical protein
MKKVFVLCTILAVMSCLAWAGEISNTSTDTKGSVAAPVSQLSAKEEIVQLQDMISAAKAAGVEPRAEWFARIGELVGPTQSVRSLDMGGIDWASAVVIPSIPWNDSGVLPATDACLIPASLPRPYHSVMYTLTAALAGTYIFDMCNSAADDYLRIWKNPAGACATSFTGTADDNCGTSDPSYSIALVAGDVVYVECGTYYPTETALDYVFHVQGPTLARGRCCYGSDVLNPTCAINLLGDCQTLGGTWTIDVTDCAVNPCPSCPFPSRDVEPNNTFDLAAEVECNNSYCGTVYTATDATDWYKVVIPAGVCETLTIRVFGNDTPNNFPYGKGLDPKLYLFAGDGTTQLAYNDDNNGVAPEPVHYDSKVVSTCLTSGTYYIKIDCYSPGGPYVLNVSCEACACPLTCDSYVLCGTPGEEEPNGSCTDPGLEFQPVIECNSTVYGLICPSATDVDYWNVVVPPFSKMTLAAFDGEGCMTSPMSCLTTQPFSTACASLASASAGTWTLTNSGAVPWSIFMKVAGTCPSTYKLVSTCCPLANPCDMVTEIGAVTNFTTTVSTCPTDPCGLLAIPSGVYANACAGSLYTAGPSKIFKIHTYAAGNMTIDALGAANADVQVMVFTDCADPLATCVGSSDALGGSATPEQIVFTNLPEGIYYISISFYGANACGDMTLTITSDVVLPVTMRGEPTAVAGDGSVTLNWATASETNNARFEIVRDGALVGTVNSAGNSASGHNYSWTDEGLNNGTVYSYTLRTVSVDNQIANVATVSAVPSVNAGAVTEYSLNQNFPNPFNPTTSIAFDMVDAGFVSLKVYNLMGQEVASLVNGQMTSGRHLVSFDAKNLPSGLYMYRLNVNGFAAEKKMLLMK